MNKIVGRLPQQQILKEIFESERPEFVAVYGRRRIGKTYLVKNFFKGKFDFYMTGVYDSNMDEMLEYFQMQLEYYSGIDRPRPKSWLQAFRQLQDYLESLDKDRVVVFIDELPWLDTPKSRFVRALELFWNGWGDTQTHLKFIVCGSATTWMTDKLIGDKGGLHNRVTRRIYLGPFTLGETEQMLQANGVQWNRYQIVEGYMALGGTPYYLAMIDKSRSVTQNIDKLFFSETGQLRDEYDTLFRSLFRDSTMYRRVVEALAAKSAGMSREELIDRLNISDGGQLSEVIHNLISCDFIRAYSSFGKKERDKLYQLTDLFTLFYLKQVRDNLNDGEDYWSNRIDTPAHRSWAGYAFEQVCLHHIPQIKKALGISGIQSSVSAWTAKQNGKCVAQVDLVIDRRDEVVNLCEMKYSLNQYQITQAYLDKLIDRREIFRSHTKTRKALHLTFVTLGGLKPNPQSGMIQNEITADDLFMD